MKILRVIVFRVTPIGTCPPIYTLVLHLYVFIPAITIIDVVIRIVRASMTDQASAVSMLYIFQCFYTILFNVLTFLRIWELMIKAECTLIFGFLKSSFVFHS